MQSWHDGEWTPMEDGAAGHVWKPRDSAIAAVGKCMAWTGGIAPRMQVVDLNTGDVVWRDEADYPEAGPPVELDPAEMFMARAYRRAILSGHTPDAEREPETEQEALF